MEKSRVLSIITDYGHILSYIKTIAYSHPNIQWEEKHGEFITDVLLDRDTEEFQCKCLNRYGDVWSVYIPLSYAWDPLWLQIELEKKEILLAEKLEQQQKKLLEKEELERKEFERLKQKYE